LEILHPYFPYYTPRGFNNRPRLDKIWQIICYNHSLNWFQRAPICMKKTNIQGVSILLMATHFFHFRNFFIYFIYIYSPLFISTYPSLLLCPLRETSTSSPQFCFLSPNFKSGLRNGWGFSVLEACFTKFKNYFMKRTKKETFFSNKKVSIQKFPNKIMM